MKIVYLTHSFKPYIGGVQYVVEQMARELCKLGNEVEVLTLAPPFSSLPKVEKLDGYTVRRFPGLNPANAYYVPTPSFIKALINLQADIVHAHAVHTGVPLAACIAKKFRPRWERLIITPHFHDVGFNWHTNIAWLFYRPLLSKVLNSVDIIHSISSHEASLLKKKFHIDPIIIQHGISEDVSKFTWISQTSSKPERFNVVYSGHLIKYKRVDLLIKAMGLLSRCIPFAKAVIIGNGPERKSLKRMAQKLNVDAEFIPPLPRKIYLRYLAYNSDVLCYVSESEAFGITVLEALAMGLPTILVEPWGNNFKQYSRATILLSSFTSEKLCESLMSLRKKTFYSQDKIPKWSEIANEFDQLYSKIL